MTLREVNWQSFLSPDSALPPDVSFLVVNSGENVEGSGKAVGAHRLLLAGSSPVFNKMLFGPMKEMGEVIEVKGTTPEAFNTMINYIYVPPGDEFTLNDIRCPQKIFEIMALSDKYEILTLKTLASDSLSSLALTNQNMIFAATVATNYKHMFDEVSKKLLLRCLKFLFGKTGGGDTFSLLSETKKNFPDASFDVLQELVVVGNEAFLLPGICDFGVDSIYATNITISPVAGWGKLVHFDTEEYEICETGSLLASVPKLGSHWKVIFEFKPLEHPPVTDVSIVLRMDYGTWDEHLFEIIFYDENIDMFVDLEVSFSRGQLPKVGEWTKIEVTHEVDQHDFQGPVLTLSVGGKELTRKKVTSNKLENLKDIEICTGGGGGGAGCETHVSGIIRGLVLLEKD